MLRLDKGKGPGKNEIYIKKIITGTVELYLNSYWANIFKVSKSKINESDNLFTNLVNRIPNFLLIIKTPIENGIKLISKPKI